MNTSNTIITHERVKHWGACIDGYKWFLKNHPHPDGVEFADLYCALICEKRQSDANWLIDKLFPELIGSDKAEQVVKIANKGLRTTGPGSHAATTGYISHAATTGDSAHAATTGYISHAATTGESAHAATTGYRAHAATTGNFAHAATTGYRAHAETTGESAIAIAVGIVGRAKAQSGAIMLAEYDTDSKLIGVAAAMVGEHGVEPGVWYELRNGVIARCDDQECGAE